jgi:hypothetical protein
MAGKTRYLLNRDGRYFARLTVPPDLREYLKGDDKGKRELREPLGGDRRIALKLLPGVVADILARMEYRKLIAPSRPPQRSTLCAIQCRLKG